MDDRQYFMLKRLHSLSGVLPLAGFVAFHLFENSHSVAGAEAFNNFTAFMRSQPYLYLIEAALLTPLLFHAVLGVWLARATKQNVGQFPNAQNLSYLFQRVTGIVLFAFIAFHLWTTRFAGIPADHMFQTLADEFSRPMVAAFYVVGILCAAFHLSNGLWGFSVAWGIISGQKSMALAWKACMGLGLAVALMGLNALAGFEGRGVDLFQHEKTPPVPAQAPAAPAAVPQPVSPAAR